jgi:hypothetical protein
LVRVSEEGVERILPRAVLALPRMAKIMAVANVKKWKEIMLCKGVDN